MIVKHSFKLFPKVLMLFLGLGVGPLLCLTIIFSLPHHFQISQYKIIVGLLLILSTVCTLCLTGLITRLLKHPLNLLLKGQKKIQDGHFGYRLPAEGSDELRQLFDGFNEMARGIEQAAQQERLMAEERSFAKLASQVIHDLRSPLSTLKVVSDHLEGSNIDPGHLKLFKLSYERLQVISEDLLTKRKMSSTQTVSLHEIIDHLIFELNANSKHPQLIIEKKYEERSIPLGGEKKDFQRCMSNIITNAIEAMSGKGKITLETYLRSNEIVVEVKDTGPGMTPEILEKVLRGGFTYNKINGNGIGMTVVREIVEKYGGQLQASSTVGVGTTFQISFPIS